MQENYAVITTKYILISCLALGVGLLWLLAHRNQLEQMGINLFREIDSERSDDIYG